MAAVARCFPGKAKGGGDRKPDPAEIERCRRFLRAEVEILRARARHPGRQSGHRAGSRRQGGRSRRSSAESRRGHFCGRQVDVIALPHPSGASTWHRTEPGRTLLGKALRLLGRHPASACRVRWVRRDAVRIGISLGIVPVHRRSRAIAGTSDAWICPGIRIVGVLVAPISGICLCDRHDNLQRVMEGVKDIPRMHIGRGLGICTNTPSR